MCQEFPREKWVDARREDILDAPYFHVVFTVPEELNPVIYSNQKLLYKALEDNGVKIQQGHNDCGLMIYDRERQQVEAGGSGCGCSAAVVCGHVLRELEQGTLNRVVFAGTGALMSPTSLQQGQSIAGICHAVVIERTKK